MFHPFQSSMSSRGPPLLCSGSVANGEKIVQAALDKYGRIDIVINNGKQEGNRDLRRCSFFLYSFLMRCL